MCAIASTIASAHGQYTRTDHFDGAVSTLQRCASPSSSGEHHALILSLRSLGDQSLQPFFESLTRSPSWSSRVDGILGLAELAKPRGASATLILALPSVEDQSVAIRNAVGLRLLTVESILELLAHKGLPKLDRVVLCAELQRQCGADTPKKFPGVAAELTAVSPDTSEEVSGLASALLLELGDPTAWRSFTARMDAANPELANAVVQELARAILLYSLSAAIEPVIKLVQHPTFTNATRMIVNGSALALNRQLGQQEWKALVIKERGQAALVRAGLQLMAQEGVVEAGMGSALRNGEPLVEAIADAIEAQASGDDAALAAALEVVIDRANRQSAEWVVKRAAGLPEPLAVRVWRHLLSHLLTAPFNSPALSSAALDCASRLALVDPGALEPLIRGASAEPQYQEILILALGSAASPEAADAALRVRGSLTRRGDALAVLAAARGQATLGPDLLRELGIVAAGGGNLDPTLLVQSAWLFARHSGRAEEALARIGGK